MTGLDPICNLAGSLRGLAIENIIVSPPSSTTGGRRIHAFSAVILCNALEWYDFAIYGILAFSISQAFFPQGDPGSSLLAALAVFGVTFVMRPLGGLLLGGLSDSRGRKPALLITAAMMAAGTLMIGLIPTYESIGVLSPILLVAARLLQGLSAGGEWGTANSFLIEWAPEGQRGFWGSFLSLTVALGSGLASGITALLITVLPPEDMSAWGWRIPFLLGGLLCLVCFWLRSGIDETPIYASASKERDASRKPVLNSAARKSESAFGSPMRRFKDAYRSVPVQLDAPISNLKSCLIVFGITIHWTVCYYMFLIYMPIFTRTHGQLNAAQSVWSNTICTIVIMLFVPVVGWLSDRHGRRPFLLASCASVILLTMPAFWLISTGSNFAMVVGIQALFGLAIALYSGPAPAVVAEIFPTTGRSRWSSVSYAMAAAIFGGFAPFLAVWLTRMLNSPMAPATYVICAALVSFLVILRMPETARLPLR